MGKRVVTAGGPNRKGRKVIQSNPETDIFKQKMRNSLERETKNSSAVNILKNNHVYTIGEEVEQVYFIESGEVKLVMLSSEGKECTLAIHSSGDIFGELCLSGLRGRLETATAMEDSVVKQIPCLRFLERLATDALLEGFIKYLTVRVADQQEVIANLVTVDSEQRLGKTLLQLARKAGQERPSQYTHRTQNFTRRIGLYGRHYKAPDQCVHAKISEPRPYRDEPGAPSDHQRKEAHCLPGLDCLDSPYPSKNYFYSCAIMNSKELLPSVS